MSKRGLESSIVALAVGVLSACAPSALPEPAHSQRTVRPAAPSDGVPGEYIVTLNADSKGSQERVRSDYSDYGVIYMKPIGNKRYVLKLERDPGLSAVNQIAGQLPTIESIQPNLKYQTQ